MSKYRTIEIMITEEEYAALVHQAEAENEINARYTGATPDIRPEDVAGVVLANWMRAQAEAERQRSLADQADQVEADSNVMYRDYQELRREWGEYLNKRDRERAA